MPIKSANTPPSVYHATQHHRTDLRLRPARVERPGRHVPPRAFSHQRPHKQLSHASLDWSRHATARKNSNGLFDPPCYCLERLPCQNPGCYRPCAFWLRGLTRGSSHAKASLPPPPFPPMRESATRLCNLIVRPLSAAQAPPQTCAMHAL